MGTIFKFHTDVDTDQIIASQYLLFPTIDEMKTHTFESLDPDFASKVKPGDFVVAAENFGCGSSREQAPSVLKALGVRAVIAKSFARIFFRNAINNGILLLECPDLPDDVNEGDTVKVELDKQQISANGKTYKIPAIPENLYHIIMDGGLVKSIMKKVEKGLL
jgi:3-isopropylmalate/(R)-2-methylmalate dehydratase large subunit/3-isopropylmalate/(R)-2-methylmalate dehydratase small subunit